MLTLLLSLLLATPPRDRADAIIGRWRGQSTCVKIESNRYCHDEEVQYTVTRSGKAFHLYAEKMVDGRYEWMGDLDFAYDAAKDNWSADFKGPRAHGVWSYTIDGDTMTGTCVLLPSRTVVRHVKASRFKP